MNSRGGDPEFGKWGALVEKVEDWKKKKAGAMVGEGSSNSTTKLKYIIIIPIHR